MKLTKLNLLSALLFVAAMAVGSSALAQTFDIQATYMWIASSLRSSQ